MLANTSVAVAYLAIEILFLPEAKHRWAVIAVLGGIQGLTYAALVEASHFSPFWVLLGALPMGLLLAVQFDFEYRSANPRLLLNIPAQDG